MPTRASIEQKEVDVKNFLVGLGLMVVGVAAWAGTVVRDDNVVPEPATLLLVALAAGAGGLISRRKK